ncbi:MAG TPA: hypothetical protein VFE62_01430 [Gemmataceae bacterium]|nr:hypothetical protein [Gemmataceae bacterium]
MSDTALAFARQCIGWPDAHIPNGTTAVFHGHGGGRFRTDDLNAIMKHVAEWCDREAARLGEYVTANVAYMSGRYVAHVFVGNKPRVFTAEATDPCEALMEACVRRREGLLRETH